MAIWSFCFAMTLIIFIVELCKFRSRLSVSGITSWTPTPAMPPSSASQPASSTPSPMSSSCLMSLIRTRLLLLLFFMSRISAVYHRCGLDVGLLSVQGDFQLHAHCARPAEGAGQLHGLYHLRLPQQHLPVCASISPGVVRGRYSICFIPAALATLLKLDDWEDTYPSPPHLPGCDDSALCPFLH